MARRVNSNTPLQALNLLNDPVVLEAAQVMAQQVMQVECARGKYGSREGHAVVSPLCDAPARGIRARGRAALFPAAA